MGNQEGCVSVVFLSSVLQCEFAELFCNRPPSVSDSWAFVAPLVAVSGHWSALYLRRLPLDVPGLDAGDLF